MKGLNLVLHWVFVLLSQIVQIVGHVFFYIYHREWLNPKLPRIDDQLLLIPATELQKMIIKRETTSFDVVSAYISRLKLVNKNINAVCCERYEEALEEAKEVDRILNSKRAPPANGWPVLYGVPVTVKEAFALKGFQNTGGLKSRIGKLAEEDAPAVARLKEAGAIIIATTNVSELCMWWESNNPVYGTTRNPYNLSAVVGGSSGGEGAVVGAGASVVGLGSDIGGSVRMPAFFCGVFGHKATSKSVDARGQFPDCTSESEWEMIACGPLCRYAIDLPMFLSLLLQPSAVDQLRLSEPVNLDKLKYFSLEEFGFKAHFVDAVESELVRCQKQLSVRWTSHIAHVDPLKMSEFFWQFPMWAAKMSDKPPGSRTFTQLLAGGPPEDLNPNQELMRFVLGESNHTLPAISLGIAERLVANQKDVHKKQLDKLNQLRDKISKVLGENGVMFAPVHPKAGYFHRQTLLHTGNFSYTGIWNALGFPATSVPMGLSSRGLPLGIQVISNFHNDRYCLAVAKKLEEMYGGWIKP